MGRKHCGKKRNCSLRAISPFSHIVFKRPVLQTLKNQGLFGKRLKSVVNGLKHSMTNLDQMMIIVSGSLEKFKKKVENAELFSFSNKIFKNLTLGAPKKSYKAFLYENSNPNSYNFMVAFFLQCCSKADSVDQRSACIFCAA